MGAEYVGKVVTWSTHKVVPGGKGGQHTGEIKAFVPAGGDAREAAQDAGREVGLEKADFNPVTKADRYVIVETRYSKAGRALGRTWFAPYAKWIDEALKEGAG